MVIVETSQIPTKDIIIDVPLDKPIEVFKVCQQLQEICEQEHGIGISAVQVGIPWKLFLVKGDGTCPLVPMGEYGYFVNCNYETVTETERVVSLEGCLSLRSDDGRLRSFQVERSSIVRIFGYKLLFSIFNDSKSNPLFKETCGLDFEPVDQKLSYSEQGIVFQHEIDHHNSILISDIGKELFVW